jgi:hypothetical protein
MKDGVSGFGVPAPAVKAQRTWAQIAAMACAMAGIGNGERACSDGLRGHDGFVRTFF